jgi:hypothetical protein
METNTNNTSKKGGSIVDKLPSPLASVTPLLGITNRQVNKKLSPLFSKAVDILTPGLKPLIKGIKTGDFSEYHKVMYNSPTIKANRDLGSITTKMVNKIPLTPEEKKTLSDGGLTLALSFDGGNISGPKKKFIEEASQKLTPLLEKNTVQNNISDVKNFVDTRGRGAEGMLSTADNIAPQVFQNKRGASPIPTLENNVGDGIVVKVKSLGNEGYVPLLEQYKGYDIVKAGNDVSVWDKNNGTLFRVGLDDSKASGSRFVDESNNTVESAKKYIDWKSSLDTPNPKANSLLDEAKKYKSAEEFIKAQGTPVYHGGDTINKVELRPNNVAARGNAFYVSPDASVSKKYGKTINELLFTKNANIVEGSRLAPQSMVEDFNRKFPSLLSKDTYTFDQMIARIKGDRYFGGEDSVGKFFTKNNIDGVKGKMLYGGKEEIAIYNPSAIQTKSQLTDIWNKAQVTNPVVTFKGTVANTLETEALKYKSAEEFVNAQETKSPSYAVGGGSGHTAPLRNGEDAPAFDLTKLYPDDIYSDKAERLYSSGYSNADKKSLSILQKIKGKPDAEVTIYRAVPKGKGIEDFNKGDWVTLSEEYAKEHGESNLGSKYNILSKKVKADEIFTDANSILEFGYDPRSLTKSQLTDIWNKAQESIPAVSVKREVAPAIGKAPETKIAKIQSKDFSAINANDLSELQVVDLVKGGVKSNITNNEFVSYSDFEQWKIANKNTIQSALDNGGIVKQEQKLVPITKDDLIKIAKTSSDKKTFITNALSKYTREIEESKILLQLKEELLNQSPGKYLIRYIDKKTGQLPEIGSLTSAERQALNQRRNLHERQGGARGNIQTYKANYDLILMRAYEKSTGATNIVDTEVEGSLSGDDLIKQYKDLKEEVNSLKAYIAGVRKETPKMQELNDIYNKVAKVPLKSSKVALKKEPVIESSPIPLLRKRSEGELRSIEIQGQQALNKIDTPIPGQKMPSLIEITTQEPKYASIKMNILDYLRTPEYVLKKIGLGKEYTALRNGYEQYARELPQNLEKISDWSKQLPKESNQRLFRYLDGEALDLTKEEQRVAGEVKAWLKDWAIRLKLPKDNQISHYITHIFEDSLIKKEFPEELARIIGDKIPGSVYDPFLQKRLGATGYKQDTWGALDAYVKRATRKANMDNALALIKDRVGSSLENSNINTSQFKYIQNYLNGINMRPTQIDELVDNTLKSTFGYRFGSRPVTRISSALRVMTSRGYLGLSPSNMLRNLSQGVNTYAVLGEKYSVLGYAKLLSKANRQEVAQSGILAENYLQDRSISAMKSKLQKLDSVLFKHIEIGEFINRGAAYLGAKAKALAMGKTEKEAMDYAKSIVRKTQFSFTPVDIPVAMQNDIVKTLGQFQSYTLKQLEFLGGLVKDKNFAGLLRYAIGGYIFVHTIGKAFGMKDKEYLLPWFRFDTPPALKTIVDTGKAIVGTKDTYGNTPTVSKRIGTIRKDITGLLPAGNQIRKTLAGLKAIKDGGVKDAKGNLKFKQRKTFLKKAQSVLFGPNVSSEAQKYYNRKTTKKNTI